MSIEGPESTREEQVGYIQRSAESTNDHKAGAGRFSINSALASTDEVHMEHSPDRTIVLGKVGVDEASADNAAIQADVAHDAWLDFRRDTYVGITDPHTDLEFLGRVVAGPFHSAEDSTSAESYNTTGRIEVLGRIEEGERLVSTPTRPRPGSVIHAFPESRLRKFLGIGGDILIGHFAGHDTLRVSADSTSKNFLPRNVGIFGTVGSGKSNTAQVLIEEAVQAGWAVVVVDVEGEYVRMDERSNDPRMIRILAEEYQMEPDGIRDFHVYHPSSGRSDAKNPVAFKIPISALDPDIAADILEFNEAEMRVFGMVTTQAALYAEPDDESGESARPYTLQNLIDGLMEVPGIGGNTVRLLPLSNAEDVATASVVRSKLSHLGGSEMMDWNHTVGVDELPIQDLLVGGRLSVLDVSETDDRSRNLAIAYVLQTLFDMVIETPRGEEMPSGQIRPPVLVVIEEVHTFVSRAAASKMRALLDNLQVISRRGRKRWMALALVSQQPNHVPDEMFELANTRFIHQIKSKTNLDPVKETTGGVDEKLWSSIPSMEPGRCLFAGSVFKNPLFVDVRPARSRRMLVA
ncbi:MAG: ATP-binding protein [Rhodothermales bacterium]|nr:ATP-binding protein [Rhodothermales bacterium]